MHPEEEEEEEKEEKHSLVGEFTKPSARTFPPVLKTEPNIRGNYFFFVKTWGRSVQHWVKKRIPEVFFLKKNLIFRDA